MATPLRLLLLEDNPSDAELVLHTLRRAGFEPTAVRVDTEQDFLDHLDPAPEMILADFTMPEFDSLRALEIIQDRKLDIPFIIVSGTIGEERAVQVMQGGATDYIIKDRLGRLGQAVDQALTQRHLKNEKLNAEQTIARLAAIVASSSDAIVAKSLDGTIISWNLAAERLYGYSAQEILGKHISILFPIGRRRSEAPEDFQDIVEHLSNAGGQPSYDTVRVRKDKRRIEVHLSISPIRNAKGVLIGASTIGNDITQRRRAERFLSAEQTVTGILTESKSLAEAGPRVLQAIAECLRWEVAVLWMVDQKANVLRRTYSWHSAWAEATLIEALSQQTILEPGMGVAGRTWSTGEPAWESGVSIQPAESGASPREGLRCGFGVPMRQGTDMVGVIEFYNRELREVDKALVASLDNIACQIIQFSERLRTEAALRMSEEQYRTLTNSLPGGVYACTAIGECDFCNQWWCDYTGMKLDHILNGGWSEALHPDDVGQSIAMSTDSNRTGKPFQCEHRFRGKDGRYRWFLDRSVPVKDELGRVIKWFGTCVDIDDRKQAESERDRLFQRLQLQIERMPLAYVLFDANFRIVDWNPTAERIFGYTKEEMLGIGPPYEKFVPPTFWEKGEEVRFGIRSGNMEAHSINENLTKDGRHITCQWLNTPLMDDAGKFVGYLGLAEDITERKSLEEQFRQAQKMEAVGRLAAGVAHDFNNLLTVINGYSDLMLSKLPPSDSNRDMLKEITQAGDRAAGLTRQLLAFSKQQILCPQVLNLNAVIANAEKMLRRLIGEDLELKSIMDPALGNIKADPGQVEQILLNLTVNAREAMPRGGKLIFATQNVELTADDLIGQAGSEPGPYILLAVTDNGCGMAQAVLGRIFEPFFTTKGNSGTGLGLATVFGIVKQSNGIINVQSEPGHGTTFKIYFPHASEPVSLAAFPLSPAEGLGGSETILLTEDEVGVRTLTRHLLQEIGYTILEASDGAEAITICEKKGAVIDMLITDVVMPRMSGRELADQLGQKWPRIKVLFVSGYTSDAVVRNGVYHDQSHFLQKPFNSTGLAQKVREVLNAP